MAAKSREEIVEFLHGALRELFPDQELEDSATMILDAFSGAGLAVVPKEPTKEMVMAGALADAAWCTRTQKGPPFGPAQEPIYRAMIEAAQH